MVVDVRPLGARRRLGGLRDHDRAPRRLAAAPPPDVHRPRRGLRGRPARHQQAARRLPAARLAAAPLRPRSASSCARTRRRSSRSRCRPDAPDIQQRVAITGSIYPDPDTHIETVVYGDAADSMSSLYTVLVGDGTRVTRPLKLLGAAARHPLTFLKLLDPRGWSRRTIIVLVMQTLDNAIALQGHAHAARRAAADRAATPSARSRPSSRSPTSSPRGSPSAPAASRRPR